MTESLAQQGVRWLRAHPKAVKAAPTYGMCLSCRAIEVELFDVIGTRDFSNIGESDRYPVGYGCEACG